MGVIRKHAKSMHRLGHAIPPRPSCVYPASAKKPLGAWFARSQDAAATVRDCVNAPDVSLAFYMLYGECRLTHPMKHYTLQQALCSSKSTWCTKSNTRPSKGCVT
jgi:hypothetical protein